MASRLFYSGTKNDVRPGDQFIGCRLVAGLIALVVAAFAIIF